jgi:hypothetical protein
VVADLVALLFPASLFENSIPRELTTGHTSEQNAVVERANRAIMKGVRSSLYHSQLSMSFWAEGVMYIVYKLNRASSRVHDDLTPFEIYTSMNPLYLIFFYLATQSLCTYLISYARIWMQNVVETYSLGYSDESKDYRVWDSTKKQVVTTRDIVFDERAFLQIPKYTELPSLSTASTSQVLINSRYTSTF